MTLTVPEFLQTQQYDATRLRRILGAQIPSEGVEFVGDMLVAQHTGSPNMSVDIAAGEAWVQGDDTARQGLYHTLNDAVANLSIPTADPTNPRVDRVVLRMYDVTVIGGAHAEGAFFEVVQGTPTAGATLANLNGAVAVPNTALLLANVLVAAAATSIGTAAIQNVVHPTGVFVSIVFHSARVAQSAWTDMPAALTELFGEQVRQAADLSSFSQARLVTHVTTVGSAGSTLRIQYSLDGGTNWFYLDGTNGPNCLISATGVPVGSWVNIVAAAKADVIMRAVGDTGNGTADPVVNKVVLQVR